MVARSIRKIADKLRLQSFSKLFLVSLITCATSFCITFSATAAPYVDANGWTVFTPSADTRTVYVSSSAGVDTNDGLSTSTPVKTIAKGKSLLRAGYPDWLLLNKGDTWNESFGAICVSGRSATEPMLISSYGTGARPVAKISSTMSSGITSYGGGGCSAGGNYLALVGIEFYASDRDPLSPDFNALTTDSNLLGTQFLNPIAWMLIENCKFSFFVVDISIDSHLNASRSSNVSLRRNIIVDAYGISAHSQGIYLDTIDNLLIEENVFDQNGWNSLVAGAVPTIYNHNMYIQTTNGPATVKGNISARASSHGAQVRPGGTVTNNIFVRNPIGLLVGGNASDVSSNVISESNDISPTLPRGFGIDVNPNTGPMQISNNVISNEASAFAYGHGISLASGTSGVNANGNIIYRWDNPIIDQGTNNSTSSNQINLSGYLDPSRTVASYNATLGGAASLDAFLVSARLQSKDNWDLRYTASAVNSYIQAGFGVSGSNSTSPDTSAPTVPSGLVANAVSATQINLSWTASADNVGVAGYNVLRNGTKIATASGTSFADTGLSAGTAYTYSVSAYDAASNTSSPSAGISVSTPAAPPPVTLTISVTSPTNGSVFKGNGILNVSASASSGTTVSSIYLTTDGNTVAKCQTVNTCSYSWNGKNITLGTHTVGAIAANSSGQTANASVTFTRK